jgi:phosphate binding protein
MSLLVVVGCLSNQFWGCSSEGGGQGGDSVGATSQGNSSTSAADGVSSAYLPEGAVTPSDETIATGTYSPLSRPLYVYVSKKSLSKPAVVTFLDYYVSDESQQLIPKVGYVPLPAAQLQESRGRFQQALQEAGVAIPTGEIEGEVVVDGSSTVAPLSSAVTEKLAGVHRKLRASVGTSGTGGGFDKFSRGEIDISDASRPIKDAEKEACAAAGIEYIELKVAIDGLTVVVNHDNDWIDGLTVAQLKQIWEPDSSIKKWSDVNPEWPVEEIVLFGPDRQSGTFDYFTEVVCGKAQLSRDDYQPAVNDNVLVNGVAGEKYSLGYFGYAYFLKNKDRLKALAIAK